MEKDFVCIKIRELQCEYICHKIKNLIDGYIQSGKVIDDSFIHITIKNITNTIDQKDQEIKRLGEQ